MDMENYPLDACSMLDFWGRSREHVPLCNSVYAKVWLRHFSLEGLQLHKLQMKEQLVTSEEHIIKKPQNIQMTQVWEQGAIMKIAIYKSPCIKQRLLIIQTTVMESIQKSSPTGWT